jgi:AsmA protein
MKLAGRSLPIDELQAMIPAVGVKLPNGSVLQVCVLTTSLSIIGLLKDPTISGPVELSNTRLSRFDVSSQLKGTASMAMGDTGNITKTLRLDLQVTQGRRECDQYLCLAARAGRGRRSRHCVARRGDELSIQHEDRHQPRSRRKSGGPVDGAERNDRQDSGAGCHYRCAVTITGTSANPIITPDIQQLLKSNAAAILSNQKTSGHQIINKLSGLLGRQTM